jgi:hypothetical protein
MHLLARGARMDESLVAKIQIHMRRAFSALGKEQQIT